MYNYLGNLLGPGSPFIKPIVDPLWKYVRSRSEEMQPFGRKRSPPRDWGRADAEYDDAPQPKVRKGRRAEEPDEERRLRSDGSEDEDVERKVRFSGTEEPETRGWSAAVTDREHRVASVTGVEATDEGGDSSHRGSRDVRDREARVRSSTRTEDGRYATHAVFTTEWA